MNWIRSLFGLCEHKWTTIKIIEVHSQSSYDGSLTKFPTSTKYILQCKHCGDIKIKEV